MNRGTYSSFSRAGGNRRGNLVALAVALASIVLLAVAAPAVAWKPYTHDWATETAYGDALDGTITVDGRDYPVDPALVAALNDYPAYYNAGVIGPDAFPDLIMGQSVIHPENTGEWLAWVLQKGWEAQDDPGYSDEAKGQILAFTYGFLTHAAGDVWAHTFVNEFAEGVFPGVGDIAADPAEAAVAIRHIIVESYVGDATPGFDGNPDRTLIPGEFNEDGDPQYSNDATPAIEFGVPPNRFIWETFIERKKEGRRYLNEPVGGQPTAERGAMIDAFFELHTSLIDIAGDNPRSVAAAAACVATVLPGPCKVRFVGPIPIVDPAGTVIETYANAWALDIDHGLQNWGEVGMTFAALFNPQALRDAQDITCGEDGTETSTRRAACENDVGPLGAAIEYALGNKILTTEDPRLMSMLGAPDVVLRNYERLADFLQGLDAFADLPNPLQAAIEEAKAVITRVIEDRLNELLGFDIAQFEAALTEPATFLDNGRNLELTSGEVIPLFGSGTRERIDDILGLSIEGIPASGRLPDDAVFDPDEFAPLANTAMLSKLVLLDEAALNAVMSDLTGRTVTTYRADTDAAGTVIRPANIMIDSLDENLDDGVTPGPWLLNIDSDHQWRSDALPTVSDRSPDRHGGTGRMPIWESCVLRPAFGELFTDWQNGEENFPALGDSASPDPTNDPSGPEVGLAPPSAAVTTADGRLFVGGDNIFTATAEETETPAFAAEDLEVRHRLDGGDWLNGATPQTVTVGGDDGPHLVEAQAGDPCHTLDDGDDLPVDGPIALEVWLDTTPPVLTCPSPPFATTYDIDEMVAIDYDVDDGGGVGGGSESSTVDGYITPGGVAATADGAAVDLYHLFVGERTVEVTMADELGNRAVDSCSFTVIATTHGLVATVERAVTEGDIDERTSRGLLAKLEAALAAHERGQHDTEANILDAFANQVRAADGDRIDTDLAARLLAAAASVDS